jgi:hypothetical protein
VACVIFFMLYNMGGVVRLPSYQVALSFALRSGQGEGGHAAWKWSGKEEEEEDFPIGVHLSEGSRYFMKYIRGLIYHTLTNMCISSHNICPAGTRLLRRS